MLCVTIINKNVSVCQVSDCTNVRLIAQMCTLFDCTNVRLIAEKQKEVIAMINAD